MSLSEFQPHYARLQNAYDAQPLCACNEKVTKTSSSSFWLEKMKATAVKVGITALTVLVSPSMLFGAGVFATSHLLSRPGQSLWDEAMALIILPAAQRNLKEFDDSLNGLYLIKIDSTNGSKLDGRVLLADGVPPEVAVTLPTVVLFNQNAGMMEDRCDTLKVYQQAGFNVVMFNYQGVGNSTGKIVQGSDLIEDGKNVVNALINTGFNVGSYKLKPEAKDVLLDGPSIGGAVAIAVGADHPEMMLAANRTFTSWIDAAEGLVSKYSNALFAKLAKVILSQISHAKMDNVENMNARLNSSSHSFTVIESARVGDEDGILSREAKLEKERFDNPKAKFQALDEKIDHNSLLYLADRPVLFEKIQSVTKEHHYNVLVKLNQIELITKKIEVLDINYMNYLISALDEACTDDSNAANSTIVKQYALEIGSKLGSERNKRQEKVYQMLLKHQLIEKMTGN